METPAYIVARIEVHDWDAYGEYVKRTPTVIKQFGGRFIARGANPTTLEGEEERRRMVIIEFPSMKSAQAFYASAEYQETKTIRAGAATAQFVALEGYPDDEWRRSVHASEDLAK